MTFIEGIVDGFWRVKAAFAAVVVVGEPVSVQKTVIEDVPIVDGEKRPDLAGMSDDGLTDAAYVERATSEAPVIEHGGRHVVRELVYPSAE